VIERIWTQGVKLIDGLTRSFARHGIAARIYTHPPMFHIVFEEPEQARLFHTLSFERGVLTYPFDNQMIAPAHDDAIIHESLDRFEDAILALSRVAPHGGGGRPPGSESSPLTRRALDRYTHFEFGGAITNHGVRDR
jgi:hypothetical protein